jgi:hypothetical protein
MIIKKTKPNKANKKYNTIRTFPKSNRKMVETEVKWTPHVFSTCE